MILTGKSGQREECCLKRARKQYEHVQKWGKWIGGIYVLFAVVYLGIGIAFLIIFMNIADFLGQNNNQWQNGWWQGLTLGMVVGCCLIMLLWKGGFYLFYAVKYFRNDPSDHLIVLYHDLLMKLMEQAKETEKDVGKDQLP